MRIININKKTLLDLLLKPNKKLKGSYGVLNIKGNHIYKVNYNTLIRTYISHNPDCLDEEIDVLLEHENMLNSGLYDPEFQLEKFKQLKNTLSNNLIEGILSYRDAYVGVKMKYYKGYVDLSKAKKSLDKLDLLKCLKKVLILTEDLIENNIIQLDLREGNILINPNTLDVVLVDLDGDQTIYNSNNNAFKEDTMDKYYKMCNRLTK